MTLIRFYLGAADESLYWENKRSLVSARNSLVQNKFLAGASGKLILTLGGTAVLLAGCAHSPAPQAAIPPAPVGHVYPVAIDVPPPVSQKIKFSTSEAEQIQQAFNVVGLKSALMVAALSCNQQDKYDAFMTTFHPHILAEQHAMDAYFHKASGPFSGQKMEDNFVTLLANNQSDQGIAEGSSFCLNSEAEFDAVLALKSPADLDHFVTDQAPLEATTVASATSN
jgi:hypothetical protein